MGQAFSKTLSENVLIKCRSTALTFKDKQTSDKQKEMICTMHVVKLIKQNKTLFTSERVLFSQNH